jgi:hypothetical protein
MWLLLEMELNQLVVRSKQRLENACFMAYQILNLAFGPSVCVLWRSAYMSVNYCAF